MAFDALSLSVLQCELQKKLVDGKITKIYQPEKDEIILHIFNKGNHKLVISSNASVNRIHLTDKPTEAPQVAPSFCMLLRKHLTNATITNIQQMPYERVLDFSLKSKNELGYTNQLHLIFELTGKTSNLILCKEDYTVIDSIKHLPQDLSTQRIVMAGSKYSFFAQQDKILPFEFDKLQNLITQSVTPLRTLLKENLLGVSIDTINEFLYGIDEENHSLLNAQRVIDNAKQYQANLQNPRPNVVLQNGSPTDANPFDFKSKKGEKLYFETLNQAHDYYYHQQDRFQRFRDKAKSISTIVKNAISRTEKKIAIQRQSLLEAQESQQNKLFGDLILANIYNVKPNATTLNAINYYHEDCPTVAIPLDATLSPQQNAQNYFKKYRKQKSTVEHNTKLIEENLKLLDYLQSVKQALSYCNETGDLAEIHQELVEQGIIKEKKSNKKQTLPPTKPLEYLVDGYTVYVGKNNLQNHHVTFKLSKPEDLWLHTHDVHSSHAIIVKKDEDIPDNVLVTVAEIVAWFSQARQGGKVAVDYTPKMYVKKPNKAPSGFVIYNTYYTHIATPNEHNELKKI